jgi:hypothetical protein
MAPSNKRSLVILGIFALVLLALFVANVVFESDGGPGSGCSSRELDDWRARLFRPEPVGRGQLAGCTTAPGRIFTVARRCELRIAPSDVRFRRLIVQAIQPIELQRSTDADGRRITMRAELKPGESEEIFVRKDGETVGLRCLAGVTCRATVR